MDGADELFGRGAKRDGAVEEDVQALHAKIGQLTMEKDFFERGLARLHGRAGKP